MTETEKVYSYLRFSTPEQAKGDSLRRQTELAEKWAAENGMVLDTELTMRDLGVSAFRGDNAKRGALGLFRRAVEDGLVPPGSVLLVENLDRLSRQTAWDAMLIFQSIINEGVDIVTLSNGKRWSKEDMRGDPLRIMESLFLFMRANEESETKSKRVAAAWANKRRRASDGSHIATARVPAWLEVTKGQAERKFKVIEKRAEIVRRVFQMAKEGVGQHAIAKALNDEAVETFGRSQFWQRSYVAKLLSNQAVLGTYTPNRIEHEDGKKRRAAQSRIEGYFPQIVDETLFKQVQSLASHRPRIKARNGEVRNMLAGLAVCSECNSGMTRVTKGPKGGKPRLVCTNAKAGGGCKYHALDLDQIEAELRSRVDEIIREAPKPVDFTNEILSLEDELDDLRQQGENLADEIARKASPSLREKLDQVEAQAQVVKSQIKELNERQDAAASGTLNSRLETLSRTLAGSNKAEINTAFRALMNRVEVNPEAFTLTFDWKHGGHSNFTFQWPWAD